MSKKVIVLADNSYTIRRIVELSFSEIESIEVRSFENGSGIKDKLQQLAPAVVIVDVKLPELNGYEVCRFVNETPSLKNCRVFLMKGSFEPVDNEMIKSLKYEDIITKPFDSNALVAAVMKIVHQEEKGTTTHLADEGPTTFPEDFPEIETEIPESEDISFSDIRGEMEAPQAFGRPAAAAAPEREEILPSEEITQGTQLLKDNLLPQETEEPLANPFDEEPPFEEISAAPHATRPSAPIEYELEPSAPAAAAAAAQARDVSDEFHERFLEIASNDMPDDLLPSVPDSPAAEEAGGQEFPGDIQVVEPVVEEKLSLEFEQTDMGSAAETMYAEPGKAVPFATAPKIELADEPVLPKTSAAHKESPGDRARLEALSPQDELARLSHLAKREARHEPEPRTAVEGAAERVTLTGKQEDRLNQTIKELLWEIVPPLAEKIIKEEIEKIKSELNDSSL